MNLKSEITKIHYDKNSKSLLIKPLEFLSFFYSIITSIRNKLYDFNIIKSEKVNAFVISVGNITTGGVGKTPVVAEIAKYYLAKNEKIAIISRGYGGSLSNKNVNFISDGKTTFFTAQDAGDESFWFAENLQGAYVLTCKNRVKAANFAIKKFGVTTIILDDAFQHRKIQRDLDIILTDSEKKIGNGKHLPAGPLRENLEELKRADRFVIVDKTNTDKFIDNAFICRIKPSFNYNLKTGESLKKGDKITAICAIGQPEQFYGFLNDFIIINKITFDDHHDYTLSDIEFIEGNIITTEKDAVKLAKFNKNNIFALKLKVELDVESLLK